MLETYKAILRGNKVEWQDDAPKRLNKNKSYEVLIIILDQIENKDPQPLESSAIK